ncbi:MAG: inorganic phosphate transporter [Planctomycetes bacterium]|nr:inorganic phosphate transporter [Planctomycetota bacterium]MCB9824247.1 inorganic phosphate transporter [Planctomycetota bacterium]MCB9828478.1 inorganic phosphate transporter [Planctomycetota bacterium]MCB9900245.1 inorganic phosphate transporter [Planctomycetota bacterium]
MLTLVIVIVALALLFDFINGMNDAANSIATIVSTRVLTPKQAVAWAAFWNAAAMALVGTAVAKTVSSVVPPAQQDLMIVLGGLCGAIVWAHGCTKFGLPISVSHSLIGGLVGAGYAAQGMGAINFTKLEPTLWFIILAPVIGMTAGAILMTGIYWLFRNATRSGAERFFRAGQLVSSAMFSVGHGSNDAQKIMGIITAALVAGGVQAAPAAGSSPHVQLWVIVAAHTAIGLGTLLGGWRVIRTMGSKLTKLKPEQGFCAETAGSVVLLFTAKMGIPVSTTHCIAGSIMGTGVVKRARSVRWATAKRILYAWILTIPAAALMGAAFYWLTQVTGLGAAVH